MTSIRIAAMAAELRAAEIESGKLGVEKLAVSAALHAEKQGGMQARSARFHWSNCWW